MAKDKVYLPRKEIQEELPSAIVAGELVSSSFNSQLNQILGSYSFGQLGAIKIGKYSAGVSGDVKISPSGIVARNSANVTTFSLNGDTGDAYFGGTLKVGVAVETGALIVGSNVGLGSAQDSAGVTTIIGNTVTTGFINALNVTAQSVNASWVYAGNIQANQIQSLTINASQITAGSITVGGSNQPAALIIQHSTNDTNSRLRFEGGSRIWEDSGNDMGLNALGGEFVIYTNSGQRAYFGENNINLYPSTTYIKNINMSFDGQSEGTISNLDRLMGYNDLRIIGNGDVTFKRDTSDNNGVRIEWGTGKIHSYSSSIDLAGTDKTAIVPTSQGYKALYCAEAPEVWFFDFCQTKKDIDPLFLEVTEGEMKFIKCEDGYQVWRRRKNHNYKRFETKTALQFKKNEEFLQLAKC